MAAKYRSEKCGGKWYAVRDGETISEGFRTKREAEYAATGQMCADWRYLAKADYYENHSDADGGL